MNRKISEFLLMGEENAVSSQKLADLVGCKSVRELQGMIAQERADGAVILSTCRGGGYFLPDLDHISEVRCFIKTLENRAKNTLLALKSARAYLKDATVDGQMSISDLGIGGDDNAEG